MATRIFTLCLLWVGCFSPVLAQSTISGLVRDAERQPIPGVSVVIKGTTLGTTTDAEGRFSLQVDGENTVLVFSFVGYKTLEMRPGNQTSFDVTLDEEVLALDEIVVIGYGEVKKSDLTGSVASIKAEELSNSKVGTVTTALQGLAPGVQVTTGSVKPGGDATVVIRGLGSLRAGNSPLFVVDGMPVQGGLQDLSPGDIESIEILKDASAAAIYGSRGSNGVVLVTTKKGSKGKGKVTFQANYGSQRMLNKQDLMNAQEYFSFISETQPAYQWTTDELRWLSKGESTDWQDAITQNGGYQNYNLSISGGGEEVSHFLGADWYDQKGTIKNSSFDKFTLRYNMDSRVNNWLKSGIRLNVIESNLANINEEADSGYGTMFSAISSQPTAPIYTEDGDYFDGFLNTKANPVAIVDLLQKLTHKSRTVGSVYFEVEPLKNLKIRSDNGGELVFYKVNIYEDGRMGQHYTEGGHANIMANKKRYVQTENTATYTFDLNEKNAFSVMGGFSASKTDYEEVVADSKVLSPIPGYNNLGGAEEHGPNSSYASTSTLVSFFGRFNYNFDERLLATFTMRADGSSRFAPGHRWGYFPSMAVAWRLSEEDFIKDNVRAIDDLKLRVSVGRLGNQNIGDYAYAATIGLGGAYANYVFGDALASGSVQYTIANPELTWEKANQFDIGLDFGLLNNRITGTIETYYKKTTDLLWEVPLPMESGYRTSLTNIGQIDNRGIELGLTTVNISRGGLTWTTAANFSYNENKVTELYGGKKDVNKSLFVGRPLGQIYTLRSLGIWQQDEADQAAQYNALPGDRKIYDKTDDNVINGEDREFAGVSNPKYFGSFRSVLQYKGFDLTAFFTFAGGHLINNSLNRYLNAFNPWGNMSRDYYENYWSPLRPSDKYPAPRVGSPYANGDGTDANLQRGDYLRLRNLEIGYSVPKNLLTPIHASNVRVYFAVQNLFTVTEFTGFDVESSDNTNPYPNARSFIGGVSFTF